MHTPSAKSLDSNAVAVCPNGAAARLVSSFLGTLVEGATMAENVVLAFHARV